MLAYPPEFMPPLVLSLTRPWGWSMIHGLKRIENRGWRPGPHRVKPGQRILIHSSKSVDKETISWLLEEHRLTQQPDRFMDEGIIGSLVFRDVFDKERPSDCDRVIRLGQEGFFFGRFGWLLTDPKPLKVPVATRGALGLWPLPAALYEQVMPCL